MTHHVTCSARSPNGGAIRLELESRQSFTEPHDGFRWELWINNRLASEGSAQRMGEKVPADFLLNQRAGVGRWSLGGVPFPLTVNARLNLFTDSAIVLTVTKVSGDEARSATARA
jgi:hypothetical protein